MTARAVRRRFRGSQEQRRNRIANEKTKLRTQNKNQSIILLIVD
jgi:hypothetical protein